LPIVGATAEDTRSEVEIKQADLEHLDIPAEVTVTAINGDTAVYKVLFVIDKNNDAFAKSIFVDWELLENFNSHTTYYTYYLPENYVGQPSIVVETEDPNASAALPVWSFTPNIRATITITAEDGKTTLDYHITFIKGNNIKSYNNENQILVFPNPSTDIIHFVITGKYQNVCMEIYSVENKKVGNYYLQDENNSINIEHLSKGIYCYKIFTDKTILGIGKFMKQ
jgi:hypothetical protein